MNVRFLTKKNIDIKNTRRVVETPRRGVSTTTSVLFSRGKRSSAFFTEDSKLYITPSEQALLRKGIKLDRGTQKWDSLSSRVVRDFVRFQPNRSNLLRKSLEKRYARLNDSITEASKSFVGQFSMVRLWNLSIVGSILFGMMLMTFVYRYLGQGASAQQLSPIVAETQSVSQTEKVASSADDAQAFTQQVLEIEQAKDQQVLEQEITKMVKGYPIEKMVPYIAQQDRTVAAFIIGIAKIESGWGVHVPVLDGQDCDNYWGYRGIRARMGTNGHTCFDSPKDAVDTVAKRIAFLVSNDKLKTPTTMVNTWKCGKNCAGDPGAQNWVSTVTPVFDELSD